MIDESLQFTLTNETPLVREYTMAVSAASLYFRGHFPNHPVLPGVAQLEAIVVELVMQAWPDLGSLLRVRRLKFHRVIPPDVELHLQLTRLVQAQVRFLLRLADGDEKCSSGLLCFGDRPDLG